jgi:hypothetical protein
MEGDYTQNRVAGVIDSITIPAMIAMTRFRPASIAAH